MLRKKKGGEQKMFKRLYGFLLVLIVAAANSMALQSLSQVSADGWYQPEVGEELKRKLCKI